MYILPGDMHFSQVPDQPSEAMINLIKDAQEVSKRLSESGNQAEAERALTGPMHIPALCGQKLFIATRREGRPKGSSVARRGRALAAGLSESAVSKR